MKDDEHVRTELATLVNLIREHGVGSNEVAWFMDKIDDAELRHLSLGVLRLMEEDE